MTAASILYMLLGAVLVMLGVLAPALADRIRGIHGVSREAAPRERVGRGQSAPAVIPLVEPVELRSAPQAPAKPPRMPRVESKVQASTDGSADVIAALVQAGYKKPEAAEATWGCSVAERATIERWTGAALQKAGRNFRS